ncbi:POU domain, class 4, transcription factor 1 [Triticum dicoccoides]|uniref:POU domain, class 4, transcription factor 1 n=1 Tax=Triticum dicoccoides TaxID=85692 RepID=UPI00162CF681|nr:POU domain, class 4, transcription factor 1 [Triticum dicoccoides]
MAKVQVRARFVTEVAPPQLVSVVRRRKVPRSLDTIVEDDRELQQLAYGDHHHHHHHHHRQATASAASMKRALPAGARTGGAGFMRELSSCFSGNGVHGQAGGGGWESTRSKGHGRRAVFAHRTHAN